ncbi:DUF4232 domain-containing protein [Streptomyces sp. WSLK1-3]|uniref:DUF4232 domain-containing protein n=1 Tax=Streptomyces sp. WSLK1-3 TaxID=3375475 RepID=UPI00378BA158
MPGVRHAPLRRPGGRGHGLRAVGLHLVNCGTRPIRLEGHPKTRRGQPPTGRPAPGEAAAAGLAWRNTTQAGETVNAPYVRVSATPSADPVMVVPELEPRHDGATRRRSVAEGRDVQGSRRRRASVIVRHCATHVWRVRMALDVTVVICLGAVRCSRSKRRSVRLPGRCRGLPLHAGPGLGNGASRSFGQPVSVWYQSDARLRSVLHSEWADAKSSERDRRVARSVVVLNKPGRGACCKRITRTQRLAPADGRGRKDFVISSPAV